MLCVFAATVFWFFNALNKNYTTNLSFPLAFDYSEEHYIPVRPLPPSVRLNVTGVGWDLFRRSLGLKVPPLVIPLERPADTKKIVGAALPALVANQIERFQINFVITDTLRLSLEPKASRWISLRLDSPSILFRKGFIMTSEARIEPDSVFIEGPAGLVQHLPNPLYLKLSQRNIDEDFHDDVEVRFLNNELVKRDPPTVSVHFAVDQLLAVTDSVRLELVNYPKDIKTSIGVRKLLCTFAIPESYRNQYYRDSVVAILDLKDFKRGRETRLPEVYGLPPYAHVIRMDSVVVKL